MKNVPARGIVAIGRCGNICLMGGAVIDSQKIREKIESDFEVLRKEMGIFDSVLQQQKAHNGALDPRVVIEMSTYANLNRRRTIHSHRKILGPIIVFAKQKIIKFTQPFVRIILQDQIMINQLLLTVTNSIAILEANQNKMKKRLEKLEEKLHCPNQED